MKRWFLEAIYAVDRSLTRRLQSLYVKIQVRTRKNAYTLRNDIILIVAQIMFVPDVILRILHVIGPIKDISLGYLELLTLGLMCCLAPDLTVKIPASFLFQLHVFLDRETALSREKEYSSGYRAWGHIVLAIVVVLVLILYRADNYLLFTSGVGGIELVNSYYEFAIRKPGKPRRRKEVTSPALERLREIVRGWQPRPKSVSR